MAHLAAGQFTGAITQFRNTSILLGLQPVINLITEVVGNDEFKNRAGTDDSTRNHMIQLIADVDKRRRLITYNPGGLDLKTATPELIDPDVAQMPSLAPISLDHIQMSSNPEIELPYRLDGTDVNLPLWSALHFRNGVGGFLYGQACSILVAYTRLESRNRSSMITVNDSLRVYSVVQTFRDLCDRLLGADNQVDISAPLATDEPIDTLPPNRLNETPVVYGTSAQNAGRTA